MKRLFSSILATIGVFMTSPAFALGMEVDPTDKSKTEIIDYLFGPISGSGGPSALGPLVKEFNTILLILAGIYVAYTLFKGTIDTAHDGKMLGKKWSTAWLPARIAFFSAMIFPALPGGFSAMQYLVLWLAMQGVAGANIMWNAFAEDPLNSSMISTPQTQTGLANVYRSLLISEVCMASYNKHSESPEAPNRIGYRGPLIEATMTAPDGSPAAAGGSLHLRYQPVARFWGASTGDIGLNICGEFHLDVPAPAARDSSGQRLAIATELINMADVAHEAGKTHSNQFREANKALRPLAVRLANDANSVSDAEIVSAIMGLAKGHSDAVRNTISTQMKSLLNADFKAAMKKDGWITAGAFYMTYVAAQDRLQAAMSIMPSTGDLPMIGFEGEQGGIGDSVLGLGRSIGKHLVGLAGPIESDLIQAANRVSEAFKNQGPTFGINNMARDMEIGDDEGGFIRIIMGLFMPDGASNPLAAAASLENPIITASDMGTKMVTVAWGAVGTYALLLGGGSVMKLFRNLGPKGAMVSLAGDKMVKVALGMAPLFIFLFSALIIPGAILSIYVPMIPFIIWIGAVFGWVLLLSQAIIAAPLWGLVHLAPDGDDVVGKGGQGYMIVLSLTLTPMLMIFSLVLAMLLMKPIGLLINSLFVAVFSTTLTVTSGDLGLMAGIAKNLTAMFAGPIIYFVLIMQVVHRVFELIHSIPSEILRFIGGGANALSQEGAQFQQGSAGSTKGALGSLGLQNAAQHADGLVRRSVDRDARNKNEEERRNLEKLKDAGSNLQEKSLNEKSAQELSASSPTRENMAKAASARFDVGQATSERGLASYNAARAHSASLEAGAITSLNPWSNASMDQAFAADSAALESQIEDGTKNGSIDAETADGMRMQLMSQYVEKGRKKPAGDRPRFMEYLPDAMNKMREGKAIQSEAKSMMSEAERMPQETESAGDSSDISQDLTPQPNIPDAPTEDWMADGKGNSQDNPPPSFPPSSESSVEPKDDRG